MESPEEALMHLYEDVWNGNNPETADKIVHEEYVIHDRELAAEMQGPGLYKVRGENPRL
jgi:hypothetical protein